MGLDYRGIRWDASLEQANKKNQQEHFANTNVGMRYKKADKNHCNRRRMTMWRDKSASNSRNTRLFWHSLARSSAPAKASPQELRLSQLQPEVQLG
jgi:hypothetical protein